MIGALGNYSLLAPLGEGAVTESFQAKRFGVEGFEKTIVLKRVRPELISNPAFETGFTEQARSSLRLAHSNIAQVFDLGSVGGEGAHAQEVGGDGTSERGASERGLSERTVFLITEWVLGPSLGDLLKRTRASRAIPIELGLFIAAEVAKGLSEAHRDTGEGPLVHGHLTANNVLVSQEGDVKISDFGALEAFRLYDPASLSERLRKRPSSAAWLSPAQRAGKASTVQDDLFSLGALLYSCLSCGRSTSGFSVGAHEAEASFSDGLEGRLSDLGSWIPPEVLSVTEALLLDETGASFSSARDVHRALSNLLRTLGLRANASRLSRWVQGRQVPERSTVRPAGALTGDDHSGATSTSALLAQGTALAAAIVEPDAPTTDSVAADGGAKGGVSADSVSADSVAENSVAGDSVAGAKPPLEDLQLETDSLSEPELAPAEVLADSVPRGKFDSIPPESGAPQSSTFGAPRPVCFLSLWSSAPLNKSARERVESVLARHGALPLLSHSDELVALFGWERMDGRDVEYAARCGLALLRTLSQGPGRIGIGIDIGDVEGPNSGTLAGHSAAVGARRLALSCDFRVGVSDRAERQLRGLFALAPNDQRPGTQIIVGSRSLRRVSGPLCGRQAELRALARSYMRTEHEGTVCLRLEGPGGIGKTRLVLEFGHRLRRVLKEEGPRTLIAACASRGRRSECSAFMTLLGRLLDGREGEPPDQAWKLEANLKALGLSLSDTKRLVGTICDAHSPRTPHEEAELVGIATRRLQMLARDRPHVVALDNAQETDDKSAELLARLLENLQNTPRILFLLLARPSESMPVRRLTPECLQLEPLSQDDLCRLVVARLGLKQPPESLMAFIETHAEGNPLFVEELLRLARDQRALSLKGKEGAEFEPRVSLAASRFLRSVVAGRVGALPKAQRAVLLAAAQAGFPAAVSEVRRLSRLSEDALEQSLQSLEGKHMLKREDGEVSVTPPLMSEVLLADAAVRGSA